MQSVTSCSSPKAPWNVLLTFLYKTSNGIARGVWSHASMATYIYLLERNSAKARRIVEVLPCDCMPAQTTPTRRTTADAAGWLADKFRRDQVLRCCAVADCGAIICTSAAILLPQDLTIHLFGGAVHTKYLWLCCALALWGLGQGAGPVSEALLADSTVTGSRAKVYTLIYSAGLTGMAVGPLIAAAAFAYTGNKWHVQTLQHVILVGLVLALVPVMVLMCFDDDKALGKESSAAMNLQLSAATSGDLTSEQATEGPQHMLHNRSSRRGAPLLSTHSVPYLLAFSDLVFGLASGMTITFFPIFFLKEVGMPPVSTNFVLAGTPLAVAAVSAVSAPCAQMLGRVQTILLFKATAVVLLAVIGLFPGLWSKWGIIIPMYVVRTAIMNSAFPLQKSILMDYVPKESRARWNSLDGVLIFGWSGSALLGGILVDSIGFGTTFCLTALMQGIAVCILVPLVTVVPRNEGRLNNSTLTAATDASEASSSMYVGEMPMAEPIIVLEDGKDLQQPLLNIA